MAACVAVIGKDASTSFFLFIGYDVSFNKNLWNNEVLLSSLFTNCKHRIVLLIDKYSIELSKIYQNISVRGRSCWVAISLQSTHVD